MFPVERNELLTRVGRGTPIGELFRRYWLPVLLGEELPEPDCAPVRVKLLGERLIAFCDTQGRIGLIEEFCAHRGVSLWFGRNEENGIRCPYHGWKYDVTGQCVDLPSEPEESGMRKNIKLVSYPAIERAGVIWAYLGPPDQKPEAPAYEWTQVPPSHRYVSKRLQETNYLQAEAGGSCLRMDPGAAFSPIRLQAAAGDQLPAGDGRRARFDSFGVPAPPLGGR